MKLEIANVGRLQVPVADFETDMACSREGLGIPFLFGTPPRMAFFNCGGVRLLAGVQSTLRGAGVRLCGKPHVLHRIEATESWRAELRSPDDNSLALMGELSVH